MTASDATSATVPQSTQAPALPNRPEEGTFPVFSQDRAAVEAVMVRNLSFRWLLTLILTLNVAAGPMLSAQQPPEEVPSITIRTNTRLVLVDVVVTDKKGQPITGLKPENFTVEENGKKQK